MLSYNRDKSLSPWKMLNEHITESKTTKSRQDAEWKAVTGPINRKLQQKRKMGNK